MNPFDRDAPTDTADDAGARPPSLAPDVKDWTWVLDARCAECGYDAADVDPAELGGTLRNLVPRWVGALQRPSATVRPEPGVWSVLEYGAHVRDVYRLFGQRLDLILTQDDPMFDNWDQDATAVASRYDLQDPRVVATELAEAAERLAAAFDAVGEARLERPGRRSNGSVFTVRTLGLYLLHDVFHHLHDVRA